MKSRERALAALNHIETGDRPCIDFGATLATGISAVVYDAVKKMLGYDSLTKIEEINAQNAMIEPFMIEEMGGDFVKIRRYAPTLGIPIEDYKPGVLTNGRECLQPSLFEPIENEHGDLELYGLPHSMDYIHPYKKDDPDDAYCDKVVCRCPKGYHAFARVFHPMKNVQTIEELDEYVFPVMKQAEYDFYVKEAMRLRSTTDKSITGIFYGNVFEMGQLYWGYEQFYVNMGVEKQLTMEYLERRTEVYLHNLKKYLKAVGDYIDVIQFNDDLGTQDSMLISQKMYRDFIKPFHKKMFEYVRNNYPHIKVFFHSCGSIFDIIPDLIDCGVQILNPVQLTAAKMDPKVLKREFGKELVFWGGGIDTQNVLNRATPMQINAYVNEMLDIFSPGGGYVFSQVHCVDGSVPPENLISCFKTANNYKM